MNKQTSMQRAFNSTARFAGTLVLATTLVHSALAQEQAGPAPRMADGKPDLSGVWWTGGDLGSPGYASSTGGTPPPAVYTDLYQPWAKEKMATLKDKDDPTLQCQPTAFGTLSVRMFDVGAVGQIVATPDLVVFLQETYHGYQLVPTDGREPRAVPPSFRGDAIGHWEGDTFVVEVTNFTDDSWIFAEGRVSFHSDQMRPSCPNRLLHLATPRGCNHVLRRAEGQRHDRHGRLAATTGHHAAAVHHEQVRHIV